MAANPSATPFLGIRQENQTQISTQHQIQSSTTTPSSTTVPPQKKRRNQPGTTYPDAEVIALSPKSLMATNRFICEVCNKGFKREQNLQLHRRGHNLPWKLKQKATKDDQPPKRKVYLCPEPTCVHHHPSRALGDLTGIKKHFSRKHGEKKWKCDKCSKKYAVQSDWKAHSKTCGTREYRCDCGTLFSRRDSFITHRAFCDALAHETARHPSSLNPLGAHHHNLYGTNHISLGLSQVGSPIIPQLQNQNQIATNNSSILSLGSGTTTTTGAPPKFEHLISPNLHHHHHHHQSMSSASSAFFMTDPNQGFQDHQGPSLYSTKQLHGLIHLPDLQSNTNNSAISASAPPNNLFNLSFIPTNSSIPDQFSSITGGGGNQGTTTLYTNGPAVSNNNQVGSGLSSLFGNSSMQQDQNMFPHMSATALLQKAAQMGSTTSTTFGRDHNRGDQGMENDHHQHHHHLRGILMNSLENGNTSLFGNVKGNNNQNNLGQLFHNVEEHNNNNNKLSQNNNLGVCFGGSDKLTLDFLGVGGMVRNMSSGGGFSQHSMGTMSTLDPKLESAAQTNQHFGSSTMQ